MSTTIFPQSGDPAGELAFQHYVRMCGYDHVRGMGDMKLTHNSGLDVDIASGEAIVNGVYVNVDSTTTITVNDNATNYVYLKLTRDASNLVQDPASDDGNYVVTTTTETGPDYFPIAVVQASNGSVDRIDDLRWNTPSQIVSAIKRTSETRTSTSRSPDGTLVLPAPANHLYRFRAVISFNGTLVWSVDLDTNPSAAFNFLVTNDSGHKRTESHLSHDSGTQQNADTDGIVHVNGFLDMSGVSHSKVSISWGTNSSDNSASIVRNSSVTLERVG